MTLQTYCMLCVVAWAIFALYFFRKDVFRRTAAKATSEKETAETAANDIIGGTQTVVNTDAPTPSVRSHVEKTARPIEEEEELEVEYEYDGLENLRAQADSVPPVELNVGNIDLDTINNQLAALQVQTDEEMQEMQAAGSPTIHQLEFAFETVAAPCRSLERDREAGTTLKDISRTDMFYQAYHDNELRVEEVLKEVRCKILHLDDDELEVVAAKEEEDEEVAPQDTEEESEDETAAPKEDFIGGFPNS